MRNTHEKLIEAVYKMVGDETWNVAPVNYTVAERAIEMTEAFYGIQNASTSTSKCNQRARILIGEAKSAIGQICHILGNEITNGMLATIDLAAASTQTDTPTK